MSSPLVVELITRQPNVISHPPLWPPKWHWNGQILQIWRNYSVAMRTLWGQNTQRIELPSCKSWKLNWHVSNSLSFYSRYDCGFHHLVLGAISAVGRHSCRMRQLSSDYPCPWNTRPTRYFSDRFFRKRYLLFSLSSLVLSKDFLINSLQNPD